MKTRGFPTFVATALFFALCCNELASGKPAADQNERVTRNSELHQDHQRMAVGVFVEGQAASNPVDRGVLNPKKPLSLTARLALLENAQRTENGTEKKRPIVNTAKPRPKRSPNFGAGQGPLAADPGSLLDDTDEYELVDSVLFGDWSECTVPCGIGYQTLLKPGAHEWRRCLGIDCKSPQHLESELACGGSASSIVIGIVIGITITLATGGAAFFIKKSGFGEVTITSLRKTKIKSSSRPPMPAPRDDKTKDADSEHIYDEIDSTSNKKAKAGNSYVSMRENKKSMKKKGSKKKPKDEESDHSYVDPDELNQPESEELEVQRLRDPPPPPSGRKSKTSSKRKEENEYEVPMENDYIEIDD